MEIEIWAPPTVSTERVSDKLNEWMRLHPTKPPFKRFLQDYISSEWPVFWHLTIAHKILVDNDRRMASSLDSTENEAFTDGCSICYSSLDAGSEKLECGHCFHTMCLHQWFRMGQATCPLCRAPSR